jgi:hypothetical protein
MLGTVGLRLHKNLSINMWRVLVVIVKAHAWTRCFACLRVVLLIYVLKSCHVGHREDLAMSSCGGGLAERRTMRVPSCERITVGPRLWVYHLSFHRLINLACADAQTFAGCHLDCFRRFMDMHPHMFGGECLDGRQCRTPVGRGKAER